MQWLADVIGAGPPPSPQASVSPPSSSSTNGHHGVAPSAHFETRHIVVKNSWKGNYTRVLCVGSTSIATVHPQSLFRATNTWEYGSALLGFGPCHETSLQFSITVRSGTKTETLTFTSPTEMERMELLTDVQRHRAAFDHDYASNVSTKFAFPASECAIDGTLQPCTLRVTSTSVEVLRAGLKVEEYYFMDIKGITSITGSDNTVMIAYGPQMKLYLFEMELPARLVKAVQENSRLYVGMRAYRSMKQLDRVEFQRDRLGVLRDDLETAEEFGVSRLSRSGGVPRLVGTASNYLVERDPATYDVVDATLLTTVLHIVRCLQDDQRFFLTFTEPRATVEYTSPHRDALLAHLLDACHSAGNRGVCVLSSHLDRGRRTCSLRGTITEEMETTLLKQLAGTARMSSGAAAPSSDYNPADVAAVVEATAYFNANVGYGGLQWSENKDHLFSQNREQLIVDALQALLERYPATTDPALLAHKFQALRRLTVSRAGFSAAATIPSIAKAIGMASVAALRTKDTAVTHAAVDFLNSLMRPCHNHYELHHESINKNRMLSGAGFVESLVATLKDCSHAEAASLVVHCLLEFLVYALCPPYSETTDAVLFPRVMTSMVNTVGKGLVHLLHHTCSAIRYYAAQLIRVVMEEGEPAQASVMQTASLTEGGLLMVFNVAAFGPDKPARDVARRLLAYWAYQNTPMQDTLRRMVPLTLLHFLQSTEVAPDAEMETAPTKGVAAMTAAHRESRSGWFTKSFQPRARPTPTPTAALEIVVTENAEEEGARVRLRARQVRLHPTLNWTLFFFYMKQDLRRPDLIWNATTRSELRAAVEAERGAFLAASRAHAQGDSLPLMGSTAVAWNYNEFEVHYSSLDGELKVGEHYPRLLFEEAHPVVARPKEFFHDVYHRYLLLPGMKERLECLQCMTLLYKHFGEDIGLFGDLARMVVTLRDTEEPAIRDRVLLFLQSALTARHNIKHLIDSGGLAVLMDLITLAQLHIDRPQIQTITNAIECAANLKDLQGQEKEWHYAQGGVRGAPVSYTELKEAYAQGRITDTTKVWASGMSGWKELSEVPQLRWGVANAAKPSVLTLTEVTSTVLDMLITMCQYYKSRTVDGAVMLPLPKVKRYLSSPAALPHIVQLLATFDSAVCSRVHVLLYMLMQDNPNAARLYLSGLFFFAVMYSASDVLPLSRLLHLTHQRQSFVFPHTTNEVVRYSVLAPLLPPAMICYLTHHGPEKFADVFLGEYNTPEAIWGKEMRRHLGSIVAAHVADFTPKLLGNNRAIYQYCPIPPVQYAELQSELFCGEYYLRHLCDELRYPNWAIRAPVRFMQDLLACWRAELEKKPGALTREDSLRELELVSEVDSSSTASAAEGSDAARQGAAEARAAITVQRVRKAYFVLAAKYHPDRNPEGRERFERVQAAYEFLITMDRARYSHEPDPHNLFLILRAQSILFQRCAADLRGYKYAGYELLLQLIRGELSANDALRKEVLLLDPATELCFRTVENVPLNADELQEEGGVALLAEVVSRCFESITPNSTDAEAPVRVAKHCMLTFSLSATAVVECRQQIVRHPTISYLASCGIAYQQHAPELSRSCIQACEAQCEDTELQTRVTRSGAVWHLLRFLFRYDATLDDAGVALVESHHAQLFANRAALYALRCLYALAGICPDNSYRRTTHNVTVHALLEHLLTPYIVRMMTQQPGCEKALLKLLNTNSETPYMLWNNSSRAELTELLTMNSDKCRAARMDADDLPSLDVSDLVYSLHKDELVVGGVFLRLYIAMPEFVMEDPSAFYSALAQRTYDELASGKESTSVVVASLTCLRILALSHTEAVAAVAVGLMPTVVSFLSYENDVCREQLLLVLERLLTVPSCGEALGRVETTMSHLVLVLHSGGGDGGGGNEASQWAVKFLHVALAHRALVQQFLNCGLYVVLLRFVVAARQHDLREDSCAALGIAAGDKHVGRKLLLRCGKLLPEVMVDAIIENPSHACQLLDTWQETPELIWRQQDKEKLLRRLGVCCDSVVTLLFKDPRSVWEIPTDIAGPEEDIREVQVGGVYLSLYLEQPGWAVRKPNVFLTALLDRYLVECAPAAATESSLSTSYSPSTSETVNQPLIDLIVKSGSRLLSSSPGLCDSMASMGYGQRLVELISCKSLTVSLSAVRWVNEMCASPACVEVLARVDVVKPLMAFMRDHPAQLPVAMATLERLFSHARGASAVSVLRNAVENQLPDHLLLLLEKGMPAEHTDQTPAALRALAIKVIKSMISLPDNRLKQHIEILLQQSPVWAKYRDQSHDLFLTHASTQGQLPSSAMHAPLMSLVDAPHPRADDLPPPLDD